MRCAGQFSLGLASAGRVDLDYVWLQPGAWGRVGDLPVRKQTADVLTQMGISGEQMDKTWATAKKAGDLVKFGGGFYAGKIPMAKKEAPGLWATMWQKPNQWSPQ